MPAGLLGGACDLDDTLKLQVPPGSSAVVQWEPPEQKEFGCRSWLSGSRSPWRCPCPPHPVSPSLCSGPTAGSGSSDKAGLETVPLATREKIRSRFHGSHDLIHRLFVCISGAGWARGGRGLRGWAGPS